MTLSEDLLLKAAQSMATRNSDRKENSDRMFTPTGFKDEKTKEPDSIIILTYRGVDFSAWGRGNTGEIQFETLLSALRKDV
jgi:hypothetical protein